MLQSRQHLCRMELFLDERLESLRAGLNSEKDADASGLCHLFEKVICHAVDASAATPSEAVIAGDQEAGEVPDPSLIYGKHVVNQVEVFVTVRIMQILQLRQQASWSFNPVPPAEEKISRAESAGERAALSGFHRHQR